jgi:hypothetical protein
VNQYFALTAFSPQKPVIKRLAARTMLEKYQGDPVFIVATFSRHHAQTQVAM